MKRKQQSKIKKTVIIIGYECNNNCRFCIDSDKRRLVKKSTAQIEREMLDARKRGTTYLEFIGGETTVRPDFVRLVKKAKALGFKTIMMATNGRMLSYRPYAKKLFAAGLNSVVFSIHGASAGTHDFLTQAKGSFDQLLAGLNNAKEFLGIENIGSNTTIVKHNYQELPKIGEFILGLGIRNCEFIFVDCNEGAAHNNFEELVPKISEAAPFIRQCLDIGKKNKAGHWHIRYVPLCYFADYLDQVSELLEVEKFKTEHLAPDFVNFDVESSRAMVGRAKTAKCQKCRLRDRCEGIWKTYLGHYGDEELKPVIYRAG
ncbi:MAG: radical SAM protein [Candidatus Portnoybacteria bacterium]|nr:radical SAM protein [Candidatus Portnoybacteria bacterium]MDD4982871.1 radical SAM protein [Candidatus Portnoybacteria bacterium]